MDRPGTNMRIIIGLFCLGTASARIQAEEPQKISFNASDGYWIHADYYGPMSKYNAGPIVILLHDFERDRSAWQPLIAPLREAGFIVLALDLRGHGRSATSDTRERVAQRDPQLFRDIQLDLRGAYYWLSQQEGLDRARFAIVGSGIGANLALQYAVRDRSIDVIVCLSPQMEIPGLDPVGDLGQIHGRSVLFVAAKDEQTTCNTLTSHNNQTDKIICPGLAHGTDMLPAPKITKKITDALIRGVGRPSTNVVYGSIESNIFHAAGSGWIAKINPNNLRHYSTPREAQARGLRASKSKGPRQGPPRFPIRTKPVIFTSRWTTVR